MTTRRPPLTAGRLAALWAIAVAVAAASVGLATLVGSTGDVGVPGGIVLELRLGRAVAAALIGASLAAAGVGYQAVLRNPLAEPYLLGVSGGAALAAFAWAIPVGAAVALPAWLVATGRETAAFLGGLAAVAVVLALAGGRGRLDPTRALLVGVVVSIVCGGLFALLAQLVREPSGGATAFLFGRVREPTTPQLAWLAIVAAATCLLLAISGGSLGGLARGDDEALAAGVSAEAQRWGTIVVASLAAAVATGMAGPIGFVGLMGPHLARLAVGVDPRRVLPAAVAIGAVLLVASDAVGRFAAQVAGSEVPAGVVTNLVGGPFFLVLLYGRRGEVA